jgi:putative flippase GtrA
MISKSLLTKGIRFLIVGTIGFLTDAGILWTATSKSALDPYTARFLSFSVALLVTWALNSTFTFKNTHDRRTRQFGSYVTVQVSSFGMNYAIYSGIVWFGLAKPLAALVFASIVAMFYSFSAMNLWVFKDQSH